MPITVEKLIKNWVLVTFFVAVGGNLVWAEVRYDTLKTVVESNAKVKLDISAINSKLATKEAIGKLRQQSINESFLRIENAQNNLTTQMNQLIWMQLDKETD